MTWLQTASGKVFNYADPDPSSIEIEDIAHALSNLCRYGGHCKHFYSVAEHSVLVSRVVPPAYALAGLLHDATEAYVIDVPRPLKELLGDTYGDIEGDVWCALADKFDLPVKLPKCVKDADNAVLLAERDVLLGEPPIPWDWAQGLKPAKVGVIGFNPIQARQLFLKRFYEVTA